MILAILYFPFLAIANIECSEAFNDSEIEDCMIGVYEQDFIDLEGVGFVEREKMLPDGHPHRYWMLSMALIKEQKIEKAAFWYYVGKLRYEFYLRSHPELKNSGEIVLAHSWRKGVFGIRNEFDELVSSIKSTKIIDEVLSWDETTRNGFTSKEKFKAAWLLARKGMEETKERISLDYSIFDTPDTVK